MMDQVDAVTFLSFFLFVSFTLQMKKKFFLRKRKYLDKKDFFERKPVDYFLTLGKTWVRAKPNILRWVRIVHLRPKKLDPNEWAWARVALPPLADNCRERKMEEKESEASPERTANEDRARKKGIF